MHGGCKATVAVHVFGENFASRNCPKNGLRLFPHHRFHFSICILFFLLGYKYVFIQLAAHSLVANCISIWILMLIIPGFWSFPELLLAECSAYCVQLCISIVCISVFRDFFFLSLFALQLALQKFLTTVALSMVPPCLFLVITNILLCCFFNFWQAACYTNVIFITPLMLKQVLRLL